MPVLISEIVFKGQIVGTTPAPAPEQPKRQDRAILIRYEDLIMEPQPTLRRILDYLELDSSDATIAGILDRASAENPEMKQHLTSSDVSTSLGRWRSSLSPELHSVANAAFGDVLQQFGYAV